MSNRTEADEACCAETSRAARIWSTTSGRILTSLAWCLLLVAAAPADSVPALAEVLQDDFEVTTIDGDTVPLASLVAGNRPVVVEFWATWCAPCHKTFPTLVDLDERYGERLVVLALTVEDPQADLEKVRSFAAEHQASFPIAFAPRELFEVMNRRTDVALPKIFVFDGEGNVVSYIPRHSPLTNHKLISAVRKALRNTRTDS